MRVTFIKQLTHTVLYTQQVTETISGWYFAYDAPVAIANSLGAASHRHTLQVMPDGALQRHHHVFGNCAKTLGMIALQSGLSCFG